MNYGAEAGLRQLEQIAYGAKDNVSRDDSVMSTRRENESMMDMIKGDTGLSQIIEHQEGDNSRPNTD